MTPAQKYEEFKKSLGILKAPEIHLNSRTRTERERALPREKKKRGANHHRK